MNIIFLLEPFFLILFIMAPTIYYYSNEKIKKKILLSIVGLGGSIKIYEIFTLTTSTSTPYYNLNLIIIFSLFFLMNIFILENFKKNILNIFFISATLLILILLTTNEKNSTTINIIGIIVYLINCKLLYNKNNFEKTIFIIPIVIYLGMAVYYFCLNTINPLIKNTFLILPYLILFIISYSFVFKKRVAFRQKYLLYAIFFAIGFYSYLNWMWNKVIEDMETYQNEISLNNEHTSLKKTGFMDEKT